MLLENFQPRRIVPLLLTAIWVFVFFWYLGWKPGFAYNAQRYFEILLIGTLLLSGFSITVRFRFGRLWGAVTTALFVLMVVVTLQADILWLAIRESLQYALLFGAVLVVAKVRHRTGSEDFDRAAFLGVALFCFGCALMVLEGLALSLSIGGVDKGVIFGAFVNIRIFSEIQFLTILLLPAAYSSRDSMAWRSFIFITAALWWGLLFFSGTRSALVALPFAVLVVGLVSGFKTAHWFRTLATQCISGIAVYVILRAGVSWFLGIPFWAEGGLSFARATSSGRLDMWADSWHQFLASPWFGQGPGAYACFTDGLPAGPHNLFFQLLSEWGLFMTVVTFAAAFAIFVSLIKYFKVMELPEDRDIALFATLITIVAASMMQGMIISPLQQMLAVLILGWSLHAFGFRKFVNLNQCEFDRRWLLYLFATIACLGIVLWGVKHDLGLQKKLLVSPEGVVNLSYGPRFWADGHDHCPDWHQRYQSR